MAVLLFSAIVAPTPVLLRFHPPVGKTVRYMASVSMGASGSAMPQPLRFSQTVPFTMRVASRKGTGTTVETKIGLVRVAVPAGSPMAKGKDAMEKAMSGRGATLAVDEFGNVAGTAAPIAAGVGKGVQGIVFPHGAVRVGETWGTTVDLGRLGDAMGSSGMAMVGKIPVVYRLVRVANGLATITMSVEGIADLKSPQPMRIATVYRGTFDVDVKTGLLRRMNATNDNTLTMTGKGTMKQHIVLAMRGE